jgi:hypothetical protein
MCSNVRANPAEWLLADKTDDLVHGPIPKQFTNIYTKRSS